VRDKERDKESQEEHDLWNVCENLEGTPVEASVARSGDRPQRGFWDTLLIPLLIPLLIESEHDNRGRLDQDTRGIGTTDHELRPKPGLPSL
jgi:hypothetical protein